MSRSGYNEDCDSDYSNYYYLYRSVVERTINGKRGQKFLVRMAKSLDEMPEKRLIQGELINEKGECCAIGSVCKSEGIPVDKVDYHDPEEVGELMGISRSMTAEIEFFNDEMGINNTPEERWTRMRKWVSENLKSEDQGPN